MGVVDYRSREVLGETLDEINMSIGRYNGSRETLAFVKSLVLASVYPVGVILLIVPALAGVSIGLSKASHGICQAASIRNDLILTVVPAGFIGAMVVYLLLIFFNGKKTEVPADFSHCLSWFAGQVVAGMGFFWAAYGLGEISAVVTVTTAQQKKFLSSFFLLLVFGEIVGLFAFILGIMLTNTWK